MTIDTINTKLEGAIVAELPEGGAEIEFLPAGGGVLNRLILSKDGVKRNVLAGLGTIEEVLNNSAYRGVALFPFPNRLADGKYSVGEKSYQFPINEAERNTSLHGFLRSLALTAAVKPLDGNRICLTSCYRYEGNLDYYPFPAEVLIEYRLESAAEFVVNFTVSNTGSGIMPVGLGWHPYFQLGEQVDNLLLEMPKVSRVELNERSLPSGNIEPYERFSTYSEIGDSVLDNCFILREFTEHDSADKELNNKTAVKLWSSRANCGLEIWQSSSYKFVQLYIPADRQSIAIEPMSCGINAFQSGHGLSLLEPGEKMGGEFGVRLITSRTDSN